jgi:hypothetical protein
LLPELLLPHVKNVLRVVWVIPLNTAAVEFLKTPFTIQLRPVAKLVVEDLARFSLNFDYLKEEIKKKPIQM